MNTSSRPVVFFIPSLNGGGAERVMINIARGLCDIGHRVVFIVTDASGPYRRELPDNIELIDLGSKRVSHAIPSLIRELRKLQPSSVLATLTHANILAVIATKLFANSSKVYVREANTLSSASSGGATLIERLLPLIARFVYRLADGVIAPSQGVADDLSGTYGIPRALLHVIYNPVIDSGFFEKSRQTLAHGWKSNQAPIVLGVGRLSKQKDFPTLVRAFRLVRDAQIARLVILGEGEDRESLSLLIRSLGLENDIDLPGFVENPFAFMSKASVFVLSSTWEGLPNVLIQALAAGAPIVSTDCPSGPREILKDGLYGELVPVGDHVSMAHAILRQLACPMQTEDRKLACSRFEQGIVIDQYKTLLFDTREELAK